MMNTATACRMVLYHTVYGPVAAVVREDSTPQGIVNLFVFDRTTPQNVDVVPFGTSEGCWSWPERPERAAQEDVAAPTPPGVLVPARADGQQYVPAPTGAASQSAVPGPTPVRNMSPNPGQYDAPAGQIATSVEDASRELASDPELDGSVEKLL